MGKHLRAFRAGANVLGYKKNDINYLMTCAWAMMVDFDKIAMLIGTQSVTGNNLEIGMNVGVSALAEGQQEIARIMGTTHSNEINKLENVSYTQDQNMLLINNAKVLMKCEVYDIKDIDGDYMVFLKVKDFEENEGEFLDGYDPLCYKK